MLHCARTMHKYRLISKKGEGTFSEVLKAQCIKTGQYVAIKCMKNTFESIEQVNNLREIQALRRLSPHPNIITLLEVLYDQPSGRLALVFELMDMNIYELIRERRHYLPEQRVKNFMYQLARSMDHMHRNGIFHRDIKPENILIKDDGLKLADFGSCRGIYSKQPFTEYISTRWYRAPECLLTDGYYSYKMDIWGLGCVFFEVLSLYPLFPGTNELDQVQKIHQIMGTPSKELLDHFKKKSSHMDFNFPDQQGTGIEKMIANAPPECTDLIQKLLAYNPDDRLSARQGLRHPWFRELREAEKRGQTTAKTMSPAPLSPAPSQSSVVTSKSNDTKISKAPTREGRTNKGDELPTISKGDSKKHASHGGIESGHDSQLLPPIGKPSAVNLMIDSTKKHKMQPKPAPTLQQKNKHSQMVAAARRKKDDRMSGLAVYSKTSMTDTSRSAAK